MDTWNKKLPIAAGKMIIENNKSEVTESINGGIRQNRKLYWTSSFLC